MRPYYMTRERTVTDVMSTCDSCGQPTEKTDGERDTRTLCEPCEMLTERPSPIRTSPMGEADLELVLAWRSNPEIYRHFRGQNGPLDWDDHVSWYRSRDPRRHDFVIHYEGRRVGVISITEREEISVYLGDFSARGRGVATAALNWICDRFEHRSPLVAIIHADNDSSRRLFERCGFEQRDRDGEWMEYVYAP